jgi:hypothetical protein
LDVGLPIIVIVRLAAGHLVMHRGYSGRGYSGRPRR